VETAVPSRICSNSGRVLAHNGGPLKIWLQALVRDQGSGNYIRVKADRKVYVPVRGLERNGGGLPTAKSSDRCVQNFPVLTRLDPSAEGTDRTNLARVTGYGRQLRTELCTSDRVRVPSIAVPYYRTRWVGRAETGVAAVPIDAQRSPDSAAVPNNRVLAQMRRGPLRDR